MHHHHSKTNFDTAATFNPSKFHQDHSTFPKHQSQGRNMKTSKNPLIEIATEETRQPLICLDIKISLEKTEQLMIFENDDIEVVT
jgi:hypothetical protein